MEEGVDHIAVVGEEEDVDHIGVLGEQELKVCQPKIETWRKVGNGFSIRALCLFAGGGGGC